MTAFAINSGGLEYYDQKTGGSVNATLDTYTVSAGSTLVVRTDTYACLNHSAAFGSIDNVAYSGVGGEVIVDPTYVRYVSYTSGSGNSPAFGAAISQGGVSGVFLGVWANWQSEPIVPGAAIPSSGYIKIGGVTGGAFSAGALTGIAATCSGADLQAWIEVRSAETATINVPRVGEFSSVATWFYLDDTTGVAGQVIPCPTTGTVAQVWPGVWIETSPGSNVYEKFIGAGAQVALSTTPTDARAKFVWQTTSGLVLGFNGTHTVGYLPPAGCKVRIPAAILTNCTRTSGNGSGPRVLPHATLGTRAEFVTTAGGYIDLQGLVVFWYANFVQAYFVNVSNCAIASKLVVSEIASAISVEDVCISAVQAQIETPFNCSYNPAGGEIRNISCARFSVATSGDTCINIQNSRDILVEDSIARLITARSITSINGFRVGSSRGIDLINCVSIGSRFECNILDDCSFIDCSYVDGYVDTTSSVAINAMYCVGLTNSIISDLKFPYANTPSYSGAIFLLTCDDVKIRNIGSFGVPYDFYNVCQGLVDLSTGNTNCKIQRCYVTNTRTGLYLTDNSVDGVVFQDCAGDYADTNATTSNNTIIKNVAYTSTASGQTAVYGTHWKTRFVSSTAGVFEVLCNEPSVQSASQCYVSSGSPKFNSVGSVLMTVASQQIIWEMPFFALGHTALANVALSLAGTNTGNLSYEFQYDLGAGYNGTWLTANATNFTGVGAIDPAVGIKIKLRVTCVTANASNALTNIRIATVTTSTAQSTNLYPLSYAPISVSGLTAGSRVKFSKVSDGSILYSAQEVSGVVNFPNNEYVGAVNIEARNASSAPYYLPWVTQVVTVDGQTTSAIALQQLD